MNLENKPAQESQEPEAVPETAQPPSSKKRVFHLFGLPIVEGEPGYNPRVKKQSEIV